MLNRLIVAGTIGLLACCGAPVAAADGDVDGFGKPNAIQPPLDDVSPLADINREPMWLINCFGGERDRRNHPEENYTGLRGDFRGPEAALWLVDQFRQGYALGARKFFIVRPMGTDGVSHVSAAGWLTIPPEKRMALQEEVNRVVMEEFREPVEIIYYIGAYMLDPRALTGLSTAALSDLYKLGEPTPEAVHATRVTIGGLMSAGATGIGIDAGAPVRCREHFARLAEQLRRPPFNLTLIGEAYPTVPKGRGVLRDENNDFVLDLETAARMPFIATDDYTNYRWKKKQFDPATTRLYKWYERSHRYKTKTYPEKEAMIERDYWHGFIPVTHDPELFEIALRMYNETEAHAAHSKSRTIIESADDVNSEKYRYTLGD